MEIISKSDNRTLENQEQELYFNFVNSLKSPYTKESYNLNIKLFLKFCNLNKLSELLAIQEPDKQIIKYIMSLREKGLATGSISTMRAAIYHFYDMNDITLNKKKIGKRAEIPLQYTHSVKIEDTAKGIILSVHVY